MITTSWWVCGFLLIISSGNLYASRFSEADSLFSVGLYRDASIAYEQIAFAFSGNDSVIAEALLKKCNCLKAENHSEDIYHLLSRCKTTSLNDSLKAAVLFEQTLSAYLFGNYSVARKTIEPVLSLRTDPVMDLSSVFLYSLILDEQGEWATSKNNLASYFRRSEIISSSLRDSLLQELNVIYNPDLYPHLKKIKKARLLSMILPGTGQFYAGEITRGIVSLGLVALSGVYIYYDIIHELYVAGAAGFFLGETFYVGNVNQLNGIIIKKNQRKRNLFNATLSNQLSQLHKNIPAQ